MGKKKEKKEKKAGKRMTKKELVKALLDFFHQKQGEVLPLKYIFDQLHLTTHPLKMLCMDVLHERTPSSPTAEATPSSLPNATRPTPWPATA